MAKNSTKAAKKNTIEIDVEESQSPKAPKGTSKKIAATDAPPIPQAPERLSREEYQALSPEEKKAYREARRAARASWGVRQARTLERATKRLKALAGVLPEELEAKRLAAFEALTELTPALREFKGAPKGAIEKAAKFAEGQMVSVIEKRRSAYEGLIENMDALKVVQVSGKRLVLESSEGIRMVLPTNMVKAAPVTEDTDSED